MASFELPPEWRDLIRRAARHEMPPALRETLAKARAVRLTPETREAVAVFAEQGRQAAETAQRVFATTIAPALEQWSLQLPRVEEWIKQYGPMLADIAERARELWRSAMPPNWEELSTDEVMAVIDRVRKTGYSLVWIPRVEIIHALLASDVAATNATLLAHRDEVLSDAAACLADVNHPDLGLTRDAVEEAINAHRDDHPRAAQALAAAAFTSEIHTLFEMGTKAIRKRMADEDPEDAGLSQLRLRTIFLAGANALAEFRPDRAWPVKRDFNRHNSAHRITAEQWTEANALSAIMLAVSLLREMEYWYALEKIAESGSSR